MSDSKVASVDVWRRRFYITLTLVGACALAAVCGWCLSILATPVAIIAWTVIFVFCLYPLVDFLERKGVGRGLGTLIAFVVMFLIIALLVFISITPMFGIQDQFAALAAGIPEYYDRLVSWLNDLQSEYGWVLQSSTVQSWMGTAATAASDAVANVTRSTADGVVSFGAGLASSLMVIGFSLVVAFWILMELPGVKREFFRLVPPAHRKDAGIVAATLSSVIGGYIKGVLVQCFIIGVACGICYAFIGIPSAAALGIITGVMNIIPVIGPWLGGAFAALVALSVSPIAALLCFIAAIIIQNVVYTFVSPLIMQGSVDIHPALMILGLMCGSAVGGAAGGLLGNIIGMLAAVPIVAAAKALFVYFYERNTGRQVVAPDGVFFQGDVKALSEGEKAQPHLDAAARHMETVDMFKRDSRAPSARVSTADEHRWQNKLTEELDAARRNRDEKR